MIANLSAEVQAWCGELHPRSWMQYVDEQVSLAVHGLDEEVEQEVARVLQ